MKSNWTAEKSRKILTMNINTRIHKWNVTQCSRLFLYIFIYILLLYVMLVLQNDCVVIWPMGIFCLILYAGSSLHSFHFPFLFLFKHYYIFRCCYFVLFHFSVLHADMHAISIISRVVFSCDSLFYFCLTSIHFELFVGQKSYVNKIVSVICKARKQKSDFFFSFDFVKQIEKCVVLRGIRIEHVDVESSCVPSWALWFTFLKKRNEIK